MVLKINRNGIVMVSPRAIVMFTSMTNSDGRRTDPQKPIITLVHVKKHIILSFRVQRLHFETLNINNILLYVYSFFFFRNNSTALYTILCRRGETTSFRELRTELSTRNKYTCSDQSIFITAAFNISIIYTSTVAYYISKSNKSV